MTKHSGNNRTTVPEDERVIRVMVANLPGVVVDYLRRSIEEQEDMELVGHVSERIEALEAVTVDMDVLILGTERIHPPPAICNHLLTEFPHLKIVALAANGSEGYMYWLGLQEYGLLALSTTDLLHHIRRVSKLGPF